MSSSHDMTSTHSDSQCHALAADLLPRRSVGAHIPWAGECSAAHRPTYEGQVRPAECGANLAARRDADAEATRRRRPPQRLRQHPPRKRRCPQEIPCPWKPWPLAPSTTLASRATSIRCYSRVDAFTSDGAAQSRTALPSTSPGRAASGRYSTNRCKCWRASQGTRGSKTSSRYRSCASMAGSEYGAAAGVS